MVTIKKLRSILKKSQISMRGSCQSLETFVQTNWALPPPGKTNSQLSALAAGSDQGPDGGSRCNKCGNDQAAAATSLLQGELGVSAMLCCYNKLDSDLEARFLKGL